MCPLPFISRYIDNVASDQRQCVRNPPAPSHLHRGLQPRVVPSLQSL